MLSMKNYGEFMLVAITYYLMFLLQLLPFRSQNCELYFSNVFTLETKLSTSPVFVIIYFVFIHFFILCSNTDRAKKPIMWMTVIHITESTLW